MTNKDIFKILLCSYGYDRNIEIKTYYGDGGCIGYEISAENKDGDVYYEVNCEGFMFHIYEILKYMKENNTDFKSDYWSISRKYILDDNLRNSIINTRDICEKETQDLINKEKPLYEWRIKNNPCHLCEINKKDHWDDIHYNCELNHNHSCSIMLDFESNYEKFKQDFMNRNIHSI